MELIEKKIVKLQDAKFKTHKNGSNEASIFIDQEIASKINLIDGEGISFIINEKNLLRALSFVFQFKKPLFKKDKIVLDQDWFNKEYEIIRKHFESGNKYTCNVNNSKGRFYLNSLPQTSGLNIRNLLIEDHFQLEFYEGTDNTVLKLEYSEEQLSEPSEEIVHTEKPIIKDDKFRQFAFNVFKYVNNEFKDEFLTLNSKTKKTRVGKIGYQGIVFPEYFGTAKLMGVFKTDDDANIAEKTKKPKFRYNPEDLSIIGERNIYFSTEFEIPKVNKSHINFNDFKRFIEDYSNNKYSIGHDEDSKMSSFYLKSEYKHFEQKIYFGSPGTGKSRLIKKRIGNDWPRITFHPELDYQGFVGAYKPTMKPISDTDEKEEISYEYVPEALIKAYCKAWKSNEPYYLIIEEINRGNCAQIFGDIFQLLDRDDAGYSEYPIECSPDIQKFLKKEFKKDFDRVAEYEKQTGSADYSKMVLPNNLSILASMNTSDQSLFPMDSAFKRRWDWQYVPIDYEDARKSLKIIVASKEYSWGDFIFKVNEEIKEHTQSEDKQIGNRFVSPSNGKISAEQFVSKVLFYLWTEIYKDEQGTGNTIFIDSNDDENEGELTFGDFFKTDGKVNNEVLSRFLEDTIPKKIEDIDTTQVTENPEGESDN